MGAQGTGGITPSRAQYPAGPGGTEMRRNSEKQEFQPVGPGIPSGIDLANIEGSGCAALIRSVSLPQPEG